MSVNPSQLPARVPTPVLRAVEPFRKGMDSFGGDGGAPDESTTDWRRLRTALWRFKWLIATLPVLAAIGGYAASRFVRPTYVASATIWINKQSDVARSSQNEGFGSDAWPDLFRSFTVVDRVVAERHLAFSMNGPADSALVASFVGVEDRFTPGTFQLKVDPDGKNYTLLAGKNRVIEHKPVGSPIGAGLGFKWAPPAASLPAGMVTSFSVVAPREAARWLVDRLKMKIDPTGTFLHIDLSGLDAVTTAATLNSMIQHFVEVAANLKSQGLADRKRILGEQLKSAQRDLATAETALEQFRVQSIARTGRPIASGKTPHAAGVSDPDATAYATMQASMDAALRERQTIRRVLTEAADSGILIGDLERLPSVIASSRFSGALRDPATKRAELKALQLRYQDAHPQVIRAKQEIANIEHVVIPDLGNRAIASLSAREGDLTKNMTTTAKDLRESPALAITEARLQRSVTLAEALYSGLQPRFAEAELAEGSAVPDVRPLDRAEAPQFADKVITQRLHFRRVSRRARAGLRRRDHARPDRSQVPVSGPDLARPRSHNPWRGSTRLDQGQGGRAGAGECRVPGSHSRHPDERRVFVRKCRPVDLHGVGSPGAADGKSFLSSNLARSFAESGRRTLLIDADLRRGELHRRCGVSRRPGLTDCLRGDVTIDRIIQQTKFPNLDVVASGTRKHDAPELLGSPATAQLFGEFRSRYDVIICDSPPLSAGIDPFVLAALSGSLLLVVRTGVSVREVIESKLEVLGRMPVRILGAILNDVPRNSVYGYYSNYMPGYDTSDETGTALQTIIY